jgi:hypothetical protein
MDNLNLRIFGFMVLVLLVSSMSVFAFGISSPHWKNNPLEMTPGSSEVVSFTLVNKIGENTLQAFVELEEDGGVAELLSGETYTVRGGLNDAKVKLKISVPETASVGDRYDVSFSVSAPPEAEGGNVQIGIKYNVDFPINVVSELSELPAISRSRDNTSTFPEKIDSKVEIWILAIFILIGILMVWLIVRKNKSV